MNKVGTTLNSGLSSRTIPSKYARGSADEYGTTPSSHVSNLETPDLDGVDHALQSPETRICAECGSQFCPLNRDYVYLYKVCSDDCKRARAARKTRAYWSALPVEVRRQRNHDNYIANGGEAQRKHSTFVCTRCRASKRIGHLTNADRPTYVCGACRKAERDALRPAPACIKCGQPTTGKRAKCAECFGGLAVVAREFGLSRERIRQLVAREILAGATKAEAIALVRERRRFPAAPRFIPTMTPEEEREWMQVYA